MIEESIKIVLDLHKKEHLSTNEAFKLIQSILITNLSDYKNINTDYTNNPNSYFNPQGPGFTVTTT